MNRYTQDFFAKKYVPLEKLSAKVSQLRAQGYSIATLNGSFDMLHAGHLHILYEASLQADKLIVALNSDASIKQYKSEDRPIIDLENRLKMLAAIGFVDVVTSFEETTPFHFLEEVKPDVHVNGSEYGAMCIEAPLVKQLGGKIHVVELVPGLSTSAILEKIKGICV